MLIKMNSYKQIRHVAGMSLSEMAAYLAVDERTVRRYEDGTRTPGGPVNKLYSAIYGNSHDFRK